MELLRVGSLEKLLPQTTGLSQPPYRTFLLSHLDGLQPQDHLSTHQPRLPTYHRIPPPSCPKGRLLILTTRPAFKLSLPAQLQHFLPIYRAYCTTSTTVPAQLQSCGLPALLEHQP